MSLFVSFTLTPMLCSRFLKLKKDRGHSKDGPGLAGDRRRATAGSSAGRCGTAG